MTPVSTRVVSYASSSLLFVLIEDAPVDVDDLLASFIDPYLESFNDEQLEAPLEDPPDVRNYHTRVAGEFKMSGDQISHTALQRENAALREQLDKVAQERDEARGTIAAMRSVMQSTF